MKRTRSGATIVNLFNKKKKPSPNHPAVVSVPDLSPSAARLQAICQVTGRSFAVRREFTLMADGTHSYSDFWRVVDVTTGMVVARGPAAYRDEAIEIFVEWLQTTPDMVLQKIQEGEAGAHQWVKAERPIQEPEDLGDNSEL